MKKLPVLATLFCLATCFGTIAPVALCAETPPAEPKAEKTLPEVEFHMTQIRDVVAFLRQGSPDLNIVLGPGVGDIRVPDLKLRNVTMKEMIMALTYATDGGVQVNFHETGPASAGIYTLQATARPASVAVGTRVFLLPPWPEADFDRQVAVALDAVNHLFALARAARAATGETVAELKPPALEVHRPTRLLLAAGTNDSLAIVGEVIANLQGKLVATNPEPRPAGAVKAPVPGQVPPPDHTP